ncbi:unnamed protein product [Cylicocyclus nassatus]|uniref:Uncharacterized protein n=1 Tax=Cylicocyclus nassatus TaxID=53992 RepID=A0AA36HGQ7_CYLNA|nr:unnamed protein product [Cylicocyclus nassatus]
MFNADRLRDAVVPEGQSPNTAGPVSQQVDDILVTLRIGLMISKLIIILIFDKLTDTAVVFRRICSYCRDKEVYQYGHNYVGFYQKQNNGPLEDYPCVNDPGKVMKCSTSCMQTQIIQKTGQTFTYRDCGTYLLQEFGNEKFNLSYTQYAMILTDVDDEGNRWIFKFCNKEKCLHPSDYNVSDEEVKKGEEAVEISATEVACPKQESSNYTVLIFAGALVVFGIMLLMKIYHRWKAICDNSTSSPISARLNVTSDELLIEQRQ